MTVAFTSDTYHYIHEEMEAFALHLKSQGLSIKTADAYCNDLTLFFLWVERFNPEFVTASEPFATSWLNEQRDKLSAATVARRASALRKYFQFREGVGWVDSWRAPTPAEGQAHPLPCLLDDVRKLLEYEKRPRVRSAIALMGFAGLRSIEVLKVRLEDLAPQGGWLTVHGKGNKDRMVPMTEELEAILRQYANATDMRAVDRFVPMSDSGLRKAITLAGLRANLQRPIASHDLRMTFGTVIYRSTKDLRTTQELLGHASSKTTERYTGISQENKQEAIRRAMT